MPTYEFRCPNGHDFERFFKTMSSAPSELECEDCGAVASRQLSGGAGLVFKGSGFYLTDYGKNAHRGDKEARPDAAKSEGTKTESAKAEGSAKADAKSDAPKSNTESAPKPAPKPKSE